MQQIRILNAETLSETTMLHRNFPHARDIPLNGRRAIPGPNAQQQKLLRELGVANAMLDMKMQQQKTSYLAFSPAIDISVLRQVSALHYTDKRNHSSFFLYMYLCFIGWYVI